MGLSANAAISRALSKGAPIMRSVPRTEPGLVASVHLGAIPDINAVWSPLLAAEGINLRLTGIFCHQSPMVTYNDTRGKRQRCELADLLVIINSKTSHFSGRRAALIQAKMASKAGTVEIKKGSGGTQLALYQNWPPFDFEQSDYGLKAVDLKLGLDALHSGTYGIIDRHWHRSKAPRWTQLAANPMPHKTKNKPELGDFLSRMVAGVSGYGRDVDATVNPTWTAVVDTLLQQTLGKAFRHSSTLGAGIAPRQVSLAAFMMSGLFSFTTRSSTVGPPEGTISRIEDGPTGITTLIVELSEGEMPDDYEW